MTREQLNAYFSFTKKERIGVLTLISLIIIVFLLPHFSPTIESKNNKQAFEQFKNEISQLKVQEKDSGHYAGHDNKEEEEDVSSSYVPSDKKDENGKKELFAFDPNKATPQQWKRLGLRDKTILTIQNYLSKGGKFFKPEDFKKIYGLPADKYGQLLPYIKIENPYSNKGEETHEPGNKKNFGESRGKVFNAIDINKADTSGFEMLPGIGNKLANRIVSFRDKLGGFYSIEQISEIYNLPDSTFQKIKPFLKIGDSAVKKININTADAATLKTHPYIKWNLANAIVRYRQQHGNYASVDDLKKIEIITPEIFQKISPYLQN